MARRSKGGGLEDSVVECPICLRDVELSADAKEGDVIQCPYCKAWFKLVRLNGEWVGERI